MTDMKKQEPVACLTRSRNILTQASVAVDGKDHFTAWSEWEPGSIEYGRAVTDPLRNDPACYEMELLFKEQPAPVAVTHTMKSIMEAVEASRCYTVLTSGQCHALAQALNEAKP